MQVGIIWACVTFQTNAMNYQSTTPFLQHKNYGNQCQNHYNWHQSCTPISHSHGSLESFLASVSILVRSIIFVLTNLFCSVLHSHLPGGDFRISSINIIISPFKASCLLFHQVHITSEPPPYINFQCNSPVYLASVHLLLLLACHLLQ